jgi:hypothetical protein
MIASAKANTEIARARLAILRGRRAAIPKRPADGQKGPGSKPRYNTLELEALAKKGLAWKNAAGEWIGIKDSEDLARAIGSVDLEPGTARKAARRRIMQAARKVGLERLIPKSWNVDGSVGPQRNAAQREADRRYRWRLEGERRDRERRRRR